MPKTDNTPAALRPYQFHGLDLGPVNGSAQAAADCPFCGKEGKFYVSAENSKSECKICQEGLNQYSFMTKLVEVGQRVTGEDALLELARGRGLLSAGTLHKWGVYRSHLTNDWCLPAYNPDGKLGNLHRYVPIKGKPTLLATPGCKLHLYGVPLYDPKKPGVYLCEGPWDGMALWEVLGRTKADEGGAFKATGNREGSLLSSVNVLATPSCTVFDKSWLPLFAGKRVTILYDSDHPKVGPDGKQYRAGYDGMRRVAEVLASADDPPESIHFLEWGKDGYDPELPSGHDVRDCLKVGSNVRDRVTMLGRLLARVKPIPAEWAPGRTTEAKRHGGTAPRTAACRQWKELVNLWRKAMKWSDGMDRALAVMLASVASTQMLGDQLWVRVISPPSTGKTQLCEALGTAKQYVKGVGNFTGLHSGFQTDKHGDEDHSLLSQLDGKTLIVKDGDTLLRAANRDKILSQVRDAYDTNCAVAYGNRVKREYLNHRFTFILAGTESLMEMDAAELGARFLDVIIMSSIDPALEEDINLRNFYRVMNNRAVLANGKPDSQDDPALLAAKAATGGYVEYLRRNAPDLLAGLSVDNAAEVGAKVSAYAQFVAFMRARPSRKQQEAVTREMSARLTNQLSKLAFCLAVVRNQPGVTPDVLRITRQVARDTARGSVLKITEALYGTGSNGMPSTNLSLFSDDNESTVRRLLRFMRAIGAAERFLTPSVNGLKGKNHWRLTERMERLYRMTIVEDE